MNVPMKQTALEGGIFPLFPIGEKVLYWSRSGGHWVPGTVLGHNIQSFGAKGHWSYELDVQPQAAPSLVVQDWTAKFKSSGQQGYPQPRIMPSALCMTPSPWPMSRHASTPCLFPAPKPKPVAELHVTTRLPRHSDGGPESPVRGSLVRTPSAAGTPISARSPAGSPMLSFRQVRLSQTPDLREPRELQSPSVTQRTVASKVLLMTSLPPTVVPPMPTSLAAPAASPAVPLWPTAATVAAPVGERARPRELREASPHLGARLPDPGREAAPPAPPAPSTAAPSTPAGPVIVAVPSSKLLRPVGNRATVPVAGCCTPKEPPLFSRSVRAAPGPASETRGPASAAAVAASPTAPLLTPAPPRVAPPQSPPRTLPRARVQVMPPPTPPREHRVVWSGGPFSQRPPSVLRSSGASEENLRSSLGVLSPKGPPVPTGAQTASAQSLLISTARTSSPSRRSPPRLMPNARAQLHTQPAMSVATPAMSCATPAGPGPRSPLSFEPRFQLRTARPHLHQWGLPPDMWGIHFDQLVDLEQNVRFQRGWTTREVVAEIIWPETAGKGIGYALWRNAKTPLQVAVMVSHAWDDAFVDLLLTLSVVPQQGPLWVASTALYQSEESIMQVLNEPFELMNQVLRGRSLLCVLSTVDVYERLWCLLEMSCAVDLGVEVNTSRKPKGRGAWALDEAFLTACGKPVDSACAKCGAGPLGRQQNRYERALRKAIESTPKSYGGIDRAVETARLTSLSNYREQLLGGGWSTTGIGKQYSDVIGELCMRIGVHQPMPRVPKVPNLSPFPAPLSKQELTPRTGFRQHWGKITSL